MTKLKTLKSLSKRVRVTKNGKVVVRSKGQDHFNSSDSGKKTRNKRRSNNLKKPLTKNIKKFL